MQYFLLSNNLGGHEVTIMLATVVVCFVVAYLLSLGDGRHFDQ